MPKPTPEPKLWKNIAAMLEEMDDRSLRGLVHDLYKLAPDVFDLNRDSDATAFRATDHLT